MHELAKMYPEFLLTLRSRASCTGTYNAKRPMNIGEPVQVSTETASVMPAPIAKIAERDLIHDIRSLFVNVLQTS
jgi:hypothetical protein